MMRFSLVLLGVVPAMATESSVIKSKWDEANAALQRSEYSQCSGLLESAVAGMKTGDALEASVYKLLGICQYRAGRKAAAAANFRAALQVDPNLALTTDDTGSDAAIVSFFTDVTSEKSRAQPLLEQALPVPAASSAANHLSNKAMLTVKSNTPEAAVLLDGILAGHAGDTISVDVGQVEVEVTAPGYESKKLTLNTQAELENVLQVELARQTSTTAPQTSTSTSTSTSSDTRQL